MVIFTLFLQNHQERNGGEDGAVLAVRYLFDGALLFGSYLILARVFHLFILLWHTRFYLQWMGYN